MTDPFELDPAVHALLGETGDVQLATLTREELRSVGDEPMLAHAADARWWAELTEGERMLVIETAQRSLLARRLLLGDDDDNLVAVDEVKTVLVARRAPAWLAVLSETTADADVPGPQILLSGLPGESAVLISSRIEGVFLHRLTTRAIGLAAGADWLLRPVEDGADPAGRTVEVLVPTADGERRTRAIVMGKGESWYLSDVVGDHPQEPTTTNLEALTDWLDTQSRS